MRYLLLVFVVYLCIIGMAISLGEEISTVSCTLGNHNISFSLNNSSAYDTIIEPPAYSPDSKSWTYTLNITRSMDNNIHINIHEYPDSQDMDINEERKMVALGFDLLGIGGYEFSDIVVDGHQGYKLYSPRQKILAYTKNERVLPEEYGASFWQDDRTAVNLGVSGLGEDVFERMINSLKIENAA